MNLSGKMREDVKIALKAGNTARVGVLRFLLSEIYAKAKNAQTDGTPVELTEDEVIQVLQKECKRRTEATALFKKGGREDLAAQEESELAIIQEYIPKAFSADEVEVIVNRFISRGGADFNSVVKEVMKEVKGRADGRIVVQLIKEKLG